MIEVQDEGPHQWGAQPRGAELRQQWGYRHLGTEQLPPGQVLRKPAPLLKKLDESLIDEEYARLEA